MTYVIESRSLTEQLSAACRATLAVDQIGPWLAGTYGQISEYLSRSGVPLAGPPYARFVFHTDVDGDTADVEAGFPVATAIVGEEPVEPSNLPGGSAAVTTHYGPYETVEAAYRAIDDWLRDRGLEPDGGHWEVYYTNPAEEPDPSRWRTDVVAPYKVGRLQEQRAAESG